jgi:pyruvate formate lyase activating enzyme
MIGRIFDIQRFSTHDGPGIRTTVFLKGCPLQCLWCHNPEGLSPDRQLSFSPEKCIGCGDCVAACPNRVHRLEPSGDGVVHVLERERCRLCGACAGACVSDALEMVGRDLSVAEVLREVLEDRAFYGPSGGGLTLSGGEPMLQFDFTAALLRAAKEQGLHCCLETSGFAPRGHFEALLGLVDLFLYDYKETDPERHIDYTGVPNDLILENLRGLHAWGAKIALRCPIIPGCNDREDHFAGIAVLAREMPKLEGIELVPFHPLGRGKVERLGMAVSDADAGQRGQTPRGDWRGSALAASLPDRATLDRWVGWFAARGIRVQCPGGSRAVAR